MTFVRNHLGLVLPLFAILFALQYMLILDRVLEHYEKRLKDQYTVMAAVRKGFDSQRFKKASALVDSAQRVDAGAILKRLRRQIGTSNYKKLQRSLPDFYTIKLRKYPSNREVKNLERVLSALSGVQRVRVFEKMHNRLYAMLLFMKSNFFLFGGLLGLVSLLLIVKQMVVWQLEHRERMEIMALFGAPVWLRSGVLFRLAVVDALLAFVSVVGATYTLFHLGVVENVVREIGIDMAIIYDPQDLLYLLAAGMGVALLGALWVVFRFRGTL